MSKGRFSNEKFAEFIREHYDYFDGLSYDTHLICTMLGEKLNVSKALNPFRNNQIYCFSIYLRFFEHIASIQKLFNVEPEEARGGGIYLDITGIYMHARALIETSVLFYYITDPSVQDIELVLRARFLELHSRLNDLKAIAMLNEVMNKANLANSPSTEKSYEQLKAVSEVMIESILQGCLEINSLSGNSDEREKYQTDKKLIRKSAIRDIYIFRGNLSAEQRQIEKLKIVDWDDVYFKFSQTHFSNWIHTQPRALRSTHRSLLDSTSFASVQGEFFNSFGTFYLIIEEVILKTNKRAEAVAQNFNDHSPPHA